MSDKITIPNDERHIHEWAYENGINKYDADFIDAHYYDGQVLSEEDFPEEIELVYEYEYEPASQTRHPGGVEQHAEDFDIYSVTFKGEEVSVPDWLETKIIEDIKA